MDATITAAWIGAGVGGGVALVGVAGSVATSIVNSINTRKATERTVEAGVEANQATLIAAHKGRLWEKECAAYEETMTGLLHRRAKREHELRGFKWDEATEQQLNAVFDGYEPPGLFGTQGRLVTYASAAVMDAFEAANRAHGDVRAAYAHRAALRESATLAQQSGRLQGVPDADTMVDAHRRLLSALEVANAADDALIETIRTRLRDEPESAIAPPGELAVNRRRLWNRRN